MLPLLALVLVTAAPASSPEPLHASVKKTKAFQDWIYGRYLFDERWVELPEAGLHVGYFLAPKPGRLEEGKPAFDDAFFVVDARAGRLVAPAVTRKESLNGCPEPGEVRGLSAEPMGANQAEVQFGHGDQRCALQLRRSKDGWTCALFPDEVRSPEESFPKAARGMAKVGAWDGGVTPLRWSFLMNSRWLLAASEERCALWAVDSLTGEVDTKASEEMTQTLCGCRMSVLGEETGGLGFNLERVTRSLLWMGPGTSIPSCGCTFAKTGEAKIECETYAGREYSPGEVAMMEEIKPGSQEAREDAFEMQSMRENLEAYRAVVNANRAALEAWSTGRKDEALAAWEGLYRKWITLGRPAEEDDFGEMAEEIASLRGQGMDARHASIDAWAEVLNNLGFAAWSRKEWAQAEAAYSECSSLLVRTGRTRNVLNLNLGDLYRDLGNVPAAKEAYQRFVNGGATAAQRKYVDRELRKLEKRSSP